MAGVNLEAHSSSFDPDIAEYSKIIDDINHLGSENNRILQELQEARDKKDSSTVHSIYDALDASKNADLGKYIAIAGLAAAIIPPIATASYKALILGEPPELSIDFFFDTGNLELTENRNFLSVIGTLGAGAGTYGYQKCKENFKKITGQPLTKETARSIIALKDYVQEKLELYRSNSR